MRFNIVAAAILCCLTSTPFISAQSPSGWRQHDKTRPAPEVVTPGESNLPLAPPSDATMLFDGSSLDEWNGKNGGKLKWKIVDGAMESVPKSGYAYSKQQFGNCQIHVEWASPVAAEGDSQGRGNSGVFFMGVEIQVLDSYENPTYADGSAGSIYGQFPPLVNVCRPPGEWQSYDIIFEIAKFDEEGKLTDPAKVTVLQNGVVIQHATRPYGPTDWILHKEYTPETTSALGLQDHGNPVRYRNIWVRELKPRPAATANPLANAVEMTEEEMEKFVGNWSKKKVVLADGKLFIDYRRGARMLEMVPVGDDRFEFRYSAANGSGKLLGDDCHD